MSWEDPIGRGADVVELDNAIRAGSALEARAGAGRQGASGRPFSLLL